MLSGNELILFADEGINQLNLTPWSLAKQCLHIARNGASMIDRLRFGQHHQLFQNGFPVTARLAWGLPRQGDPDLGRWLSDEACYAEHGNGVVVFAPKLMLRAKSDPRQLPLTKLNGVLRWRHASNAFLLFEIQSMLSGLQKCARHVSVASGCGEVERGHRKLAQAHLSYVSVTLEPYDEQAVRATLQLLGWVQSLDYWYRKPKAEAGGSIILKIHPAASKQISSDHEVQPEPHEGLIHLEGPELAVELARMAMSMRSAHHVGQMLDHVQNTLTTQVSVTAFRRLATQQGCDSAANEAIQVIEQLCGGSFVASLPASDKENRCTE